MVLNTLIGISAFFSVLLLAMWAMQGIGRPADARIRALSFARQQGSGLASISFQQRVVAPLIESIGHRVAALLPGAFVNRTERRLVLAGQPLRTTTFYAMMLTIGAILSGMYLLLVFAVSDGFPSVLALMPTVLFGIFGMYLVAFWLSAQAKSRQAAMVRGLPDSMDLLTVCVEAGLGLDAAFHRVAQKQSGPLVDEIRRMLRELGLGKARRDALLDLAERTQIDDVRTFVNAVSQAEQLGTSLAPVLRAQSQRLRVRRRQRAEEEARRVPVKMVFPLVFCLMPSLFIFIIGPIAVNFYTYVSRP